MAAAALRELHDASGLRRALLDRRNHEGTKLVVGRRCGIAREVGIARRRRHVSVPQQLTDHRQANALRGGQACVAMPEIMQPDIIEPSKAPSNGPRAGQVLVRLAGNCSRDDVRTDAGKTMQDFDGGIVEVNGARLVVF